MSKLQNYLSQSGTYKKSLGLGLVFALLFQMFAFGALAVSTASAHEDDRGRPHRHHSLTVTKVVSGGDRVVADFPLFLNGMSITSGVATTTLSAGTYKVTETNHPHYHATFSGDCAADGTVTFQDDRGNRGRGHGGNWGHAKHCVITNTYKPGVATTTLTVTKVVSGGDRTVADFPLFLNGMAITSGVATTTDAGTYTVTETSHPHYQATFSGDCAANGTVTLNKGDVKHCVITNTHIAPTPVVAPVATTTPTQTQTQSQNVEQNQNVNVNVNSTGANQIVGSVPMIAPVAGQVLGATSFVPGFPVTGGDPVASARENAVSGTLLALATVLMVSGLGIRGWRSASSR